MRAVHAGSAAERAEAQVLLVERALDLVSKGYLGLGLGLALGVGSG